MTKHRSTSHVDESIKASEQAAHEEHHGELEPAPSPPPTEPKREPVTHQAVSVGRVVHYRDKLSQGVLEAALVCGVNDNGTVQLAVWSSGGTQRTEMGVTQGTDPGQWRWPARV